MSKKYTTPDNLCSNNVTSTDGVSTSFILKLQKYGEVLISEDVDEFILCCTKCAEIFFDYSKFLKHVINQHDVVLIAHNQENADWQKDWSDVLDSEVTVEVDVSKENIDSFAKKEFDQENVFDDASIGYQFVKNSHFKSKGSGLGQPDYSTEYLVDECSELEPDTANDEQISEWQRNKVLKAPHSLISNKRYLWYFIDLYREHPCLWRASHEHIADRAKRFEAIEQIAAAMHQRFHFQISTAKVSKTIRNIRACYFREYYRKAATPNGTYKSKPWYYSKLSFIKNPQNYEEQDIGKNCEQDKDIVKCMPKCTKCQRHFRTRHGLAMHQRTHSPCKPFRCHQCEKSFSSRANLQAHTVSHLPVTERRYTCDFCGLKIALHHNYLVHLRRHTKLFAHHCLICGKGAANSTELKHHVLEHTGERPHCCEICGLTFKLHGTLKRHRQQHEQ